MGGLFSRRGAESITDEARERIYGFLAALLSHPDEGRWGRVLNPQAQRTIIATADAIRASARDLDYPLEQDELPADQLDLRCLIVELCQPLEHLKGEYERVLCSRRRGPDCSPFELDHREPGGEYLLIERLAGFATWYRAFGLYLDDRIPARPDHLACELEFMYCLLVQRRLAARLARVDPEAARFASRCDLAQRQFFGDHLAAWLGSFAVALRQSPGGGCFEALGRFLSAWLPLDRHLLGLPDESGDVELTEEEFAVGSGRRD